MRPRRPLLLPLYTPDGLLRAHCLRQFNVLHIDLFKALLLSDLVPGRLLHRVHVDHGAFKPKYSPI